MAKKKKNGKKPTAAAMIAAIAKHKGYVTLACQELKIGRTSFYHYLKDYPTVQTALSDIREDRHEWVENKLIGQINANSLTAIIFYLKTQGKHLGYVERQEIDLRNIDEEIEQELERLAAE